MPDYGLRVHFVCAAEQRAEEFMANMAVLEGCRGEISASGKLGLSGDEKDLVILADMVEIDTGKRASPQLLAQCRHSGIPVLAVVNSGHKERAALFAAGFSDIVYYPFLAMELATRLGTVAAFRVLRWPLPEASFAEAIDAGSSHRATAKERKLVNDTCAFLVKDIVAEFSLHALARHMGSNHNSLTRAFRNVLGIGPYAWLRERRLDEAARLLRTSTLSIGEIGFAVGYGEPANFATAFRQSRGLSPSAYRRMMMRSQA
ncbi:helix-turn-helix transcriptional regulator [Neorhizobium alkalisoli]|uniref:AraC-like DNA-binding protein n=1 Tax=Neorhizobium alkalisoli TaxID=528178 RepID=A0A561R2C3_9HYPH|nr:helix-turn-helix transcriptional regulator [Neorhizobium alkalisoli]TWF56765.1 AraC-like DNA-binding protein [Neorhizobium alkalisoli]